jgi:hypothetical protein
MPSRSPRTRPRSACPACTPMPGTRCGRVRGDRHRGQHAHRLVLDLQQDQRRRAAAGHHCAHLRGRASHALVDWLTSGILARFPNLRIALSEGQVGWMPFLLERLDEAWDHARGYAKTQEKVPERRPSSYVPGRVFGCVFDDQVGLALRDRVGMAQIMFETTRTATRRSRTRRTPPPPSPRRPACRNRKPGGCCAATPSPATAWTATASPTDRRTIGGHPLSSVGRHVHRTRPCYGPDAARAQPIVKAVTGKPSAKLRTCRRRPTMTSVTLYSDARLAGTQRALARA